MESKETPAISHEQKLIRKMARSKLSIFSKREIRTMYSSGTVNTILPEYSRKPNSMRQRPNPWCSRRGVYSYVAFLRIRSGNQAPVASEPPGLVFYSGMPRMPYICIIRINHVSMKTGCKNTYMQKTVRGILIRAVGLILCRKHKK